MKDMELPTGFEEVRTLSLVELLLPHAVARDVNEQKGRRKEELEAIRQAELAESRKSAVGLLAEPGRARERVAKAAKRLLRLEPKQGFYRVLPDYARLVDLDASGDTGASADRDVNERNSRIREKLLSLGPDRRIAMPSSWRDQIAELERCMPHFKAPLRVVRNALALAEATGVPPRIPPMLLLGPPGVGKTRFSHQLAEMLGAPHQSISFDQPTAGTQLRGSDKYWSNSEPGYLFKMIALGDCANPVLLLDELDKSAGGGGKHQLDPLGQLHGALERETASRLLDISTDIRIDASLATYVATANSIQGVGPAILSRMEVFTISPPSLEDSIMIATQIARQTLQRLGLEGSLELEPRALVLLGHLSPRQMTRAMESAVAAVVEAGCNAITESMLWLELQLNEDKASSLH